VQLGGGLVRFLPLSGNRSLEARVSGEKRVWETVLVIERSPQARGYRYRSGMVQRNAVPVGKPSNIRVRGTQVALARPIKKIRLRMVIALMTALLIPCHRFVFHLPRRGLVTAQGCFHFRLSSSAY
jgi:hypothetical protein